MAEAEAAHVLSATVVVRHDVVLAVERVATGSYPRHRRYFSPRGTGTLRAAAAAAQESVDGAVAPVIAALRIALGCRSVRFTRDRWPLHRPRASDRQQRQRCAAEEHGRQAAECTAARRAPRQSAGHSSHPTIEAWHPLLLLCNHKISVLT